MGVQGLWQLLQPTGCPITLESLDGKVLGIGILVLLYTYVSQSRISLIILDILHDCIGSWGFQNMLCLCEICVT